jgi:hypothetical protein
MKRMFVGLVAILLVGSFVPSASAVTTRQKVPFSTTVIGCGQRVHVSGELLLIDEFTINSGGGFHGTFVLVPMNVVGVSASGVKYHAVGGQRETFSVSGSGTFTETFTSQFILISENGDQNLQVIETFHITVTPNGDVTAFVDNFRVRCVG